MDLHLIRIKLIYNTQAQTNENDIMMSLNAPLVTTFDCSKLLYGSVVIEKSIKIQL